MRYEVCSCDPVVVRDENGDFVAMTLGCNEDVATQQDYDYATRIARALNRDAALGEVRKALKNINHMGPDDGGGYCICPRQDGSAPDEKHSTACAQARQALAALDAAEVAP